MYLLNAVAFANSLTNLLSSASIREKMDISRSTFWRLRKNPDFPAPVILYGSLERWNAEEVEAFLNSRRKSQ